MMLDFHLVKEAINETVPALFEKEGWGTLPFQSDLLCDMTVDEFVTLAEVTGHMGFWQWPGRLCAALYECLNANHRDEEGRHLARGVIESLQGLPSGVSPGAVFFVSAHAYMINESREKMIGEIQTAVLSEQAENWLGSIRSALHELAQTAEAGEKARKDPLSILPLKGRKRQEAELGLALIREDLTDAVTTIGLLVDKQLDRLQEHGDKSRVAVLRNEGLVPGNLRATDTAPMVYQHLEAATDLIRRGDHIRGPGQKARTVFSTWGIIIDEGSARRARNR